MSDNTVEKVKETIVQDTKTEGDNDALATLRDLDVTGKIKGFVKEIQKVDDDEGKLTPQALEEGENVAWLFAVYV